MSPAGRNAALALLDEALTVLEERKVWSSPEAGTGSPRHSGGCRTPARGGAAPRGRDRKGHAAHPHPWRLQSRAGAGLRWRCLHRRFRRRARPSGVERRRKDSPLVDVRQPHPRLRHGRRPCGTSPARKSTASPRPGSGACSMARFRSRACGPSSPVTARGRLGGTENGLTDLFLLMQTARQLRMEQGRPADCVRLCAAQSPPACGQACGGGGGPHRP